MSPVVATTGIRSLSPALVSCSDHVVRTSNATRGQPHRDRRAYRRCLRAGRSQSQRGADGRGGEVCRVGMGPRTGLPGSARLRREPAATARRACRTSGGGVPRLARALALDWASAGATRCGRCCRLRSAYTPSTRCACWSASTTWEPSCVYVRGCCWRSTFRAKPRRTALPPPTCGRPGGRFVALPHVDLRGLMTMAPESAVPAAARPTFDGLRQLATNSPRKSQQLRCRNSRWA